jgi:hypothetical protein
VGVLTSMTKQSRLIQADYKNNVFSILLNFQLFQIGRKGMPFDLNNRLDILDKNGKWLEAVITDITGNKIKVTFKGYISQNDEVIDTVKESFKIKEVGALSHAQGWAK